MKQKIEELAKAQAKADFENPDSVWAQVNFTNSLHFQGMSREEQQMYKDATEAEMSRLLKEKTKG